MNAPANAPVNKITTSQTIGPFSHEAWQWSVDLTANVETTAPTVTVRGVIYDGDGTPVNDAQLEAWNPHALEAEAQVAIPGFRRVPSGEAGGFEFRLSRPADAPADAPAAFVTIFARGLVKHQFTAVFLEDAPLSPILAQVPEARRGTLLARRQPDGSYRWDIRMQGDGETVFFDYT
ncbi:protocatechuate 3,4-dioxygenase [Massilia dura]|uniref:Protocatechuate 3,4-dioxygenase n=1 Tax=Pseudoduganella dura TaxID=321982 RepID=A0A6I3XER4_9BURK|nr:protocatechuate 3,4-dioxygenase [Pseudoduganella dura]MUI11238.1 protocatechuate 3,4-dioxygenase [Pseudoduganella dura]